MARPPGGYYLADGTRVPGVTTVLVKNPDPLVWWGWTEGYAQAKRGDVLKVRETGEQAAQAGTLAHAMIERWVNGLPIGDAIEEEHSDDVISKARQAFDSFLEWFDATSMKIESHERPMVSEAHRFGGTPDALARNERGEAVLLDWKSGKKAKVYPETIVQLAAYAKLIEEVEVEEVKGFHAVVFSREEASFGHFSFSPHQIERAWELFLVSRKLYDLKREVGKYV